MNTKPISSKNGIMSRAETIFCLGLATLALPFLGSCAYSIDKYAASPASVAPGSQTVTIATSAATIGTPGTVALNTGVLELKNNGTQDWGCTKTGAAGAQTGSGGTYDDVDNVSTDYGMIFTPPSYMKVNALKLFLRRSGAPTGTIFASVYNSDGTNPTTSVAASTSILFSDIVGISGFTSFSLSTPLIITAAHAYSLSSQNNGDWAGYDGVGNKYSLRGTNVVADCTDFALARKSTDGGTTWAASTQKDYFAINADIQFLTGNATWILTGLGGLWDFSVFAMTENSGGTGGTLTYDVGVGESATVPSYSQTGLTKAQVKALTGLSGTYLYLKVYFNVNSPGWDNATISGGTIVAAPL